MKYLFHYLILFLLINQTLYAQNDSSESFTGDRIMSKKGVVIGPEKGDIALGIDASPFLEYLGNMFKISDENNPAPEFGFTAQNPGMIYVKRMRSDKSAIGLAFRLGFSHEVDKDGTGIDSSNIDKYISSGANIGVKLNFERSPFMRSRVRGFYGWSTAVGLSPYSGFSYSNPGLYLVGSYKFKDALNTNANYLEKGGNTVTLGVGGYAGVEYFIAPKVSVGGQFNLMLMYAYQLQRKYVPETGSEIIVDSGRSEIMLDNMASGSLNLMVYF